MTNQITHDPTRGWLLLTEKWPEQKEGHFYTQGWDIPKMKARCLSTAIEIAKEDWDEIRIILGHQSSTFVESQEWKFADHHPYSVDAEFEVKCESSRTDRNEWYEYKGPDWMIERERGLPNPNFKYRKITRLVKAKEMGDIGDAHRKVMEEAARHGQPREYDFSNERNPTDSVTSDGTCPKCGATMLYANCTSEACDPHKYFTEPTESQDELWEELARIINTYNTDVARRRFRIERI